MEHQIKEEQGNHIVLLHGEVDLESSPKARQVMLEAVGRGKKNPGGFGIRDLHGQFRHCQLG